MTECTDTRFPMKRLPGISVPALENFVAKRFPHNISMKMKLDLEICFDDNFSWFLLPKVEKGIVPAECLAVYKPLQFTRHATLLELDEWEYGGAEISLGQFLTACVVECAKQPDEHYSLTDKASNLGLIRGIDGMLWAANGYIDRRKGLSFKTNLLEELENQVLSSDTRIIRHAPSQYEMPLLSFLSLAPPQQREVPSVLVT